MSEREQCVRLWTHVTTLHTFIESMPANSLCEGTTRAYNHLAAAYWEHYSSPPDRITWNVDGSRKE